MSIVAPGTGTPPGPVTVPRSTVQPPRPHSAPVAMIAPISRGGAAVWNGPSTVLGVPGPALLSRSTSEDSASRSESRMNSCPVAGAELAGPGQEVEPVPPLIRRRPGLPDELVQMPDQRGQQRAGARVVGPHQLEHPVGEAGSRGFPRCRVRHGLLLTPAGASGYRA